MGFGHTAKRTSATLQLLCVGLTVEDINTMLELQPTWAEPWEGGVHFTENGMMDGKDGCFWHFEVTHPTSVEGNDQLRHLLRLVLPLRSRLEEMRPSPRITICVCWDTTSTFGLLAPEVAPDCIRGLAELGARLQIEVIEPRES